MSSEPRQELSYAAPVQSTYVHVLRQPGRIDVEVGPMPTSLFVATLIPYAIHVGLIAGVGVWLSHTSRGGRQGIFWLLLAVNVFWSALMIVRLVRHRGAPRRVGATPAGVYYRDARTGESPVEIPASDLSSIGVRRRWWAPWIFELVAVPRTRFFKMDSHSRDPKVLLAGLVRWDLQNLAADLRDVVPVSAA